MRIMTFKALMAIRTLLEASDRELMNSPSWCRLTWATSRICRERQQRFNREAVPAYSTHRYIEGPTARLLTRLWSSVRVCKEDLGSSALSRERQLCRSVAASVQEPCQYIAMTKEGHRVCYDSHVLVAFVCEIRQAQCRFSSRSETIQGERTHHHRLQRCRQTCRSSSSLQRPVDSPSMGLLGR